MSSLDLGVSSIYVDGEREEIMGWDLCSRLLDYDVQQKMAEALTRIAEESGVVMEKAVNPVQFRMEADVEGHQITLHIQLTSGTL